MPIDYSPSKYCLNEDSYGCVCVKCGMCGREFVKRNAHLVLEQILEQESRKCLNANI